MRKRLLDYIRYLTEECGKEHTREEWEALQSDLLVQIGFFQHERLVHLIVTVLFAVLTFGAVALLMVTGKIVCLVLAVALLVLLVPYIWHYYVLENGTQTLYSFYDTTVQKLK